MCSFTFLVMFLVFQVETGHTHLLLWHVTLSRNIALLTITRRDTAPVVISQKLHPAPTESVPTITAVYWGQCVPISEVFPRLLQYYCLPHPHAALYFRPMYQAVIRLIHQRHSFVHILAIVCYMLVPQYHLPHKQSQFSCSFYWLTGEIISE